MPKTVRYKSAADYVTAEIQRMILSGQLGPGARVDQLELAAALDVSRHPVRQAIERLAERGFVQLSPHRSAVVAELSVADMEELYRLRIRLESWAARDGWTALAGNPAPLEACYTALQRADPRADMDAYMAANRAFHLGMYAGCGNRHLIRSITTLFDLSERYQRTALVQPERLVRSMQDHAAMMAAIAAGDLAALLLLIERHNLGTEATVREQIG